MMVEVTRQLIGGILPGNFLYCVFCSVPGQPAAGCESAVGGLRRPHGVSEQRFRGREFPPAAEAAGVLPAAAHPQWEEQRDRLGKGEVLILVC